MSRTLTIPSHTHSLSCLPCTWMLIVHAMPQQQVTPYKSPRGSHSQAGLGYSFSVFLTHFPVCVFQLLFMSPAFPFPGPSHGLQWVLACLPLPVACPSLVLVFSCCHAHLLWVQHSLCDHCTTARSCILLLVQKLSLLSLDCELPKGWDSSLHPCTAPMPNRRGCVNVLGLPMNAAETSL